MRIGHVALSYRPIIGGAEVYIDRLLAELERRGHSCRVYQADPGGEQGRCDPRILAVRNLSRSPLHSFNLGLLAQTRSLRREDRLIIHDSFHFPPVAWHRGSIVLSHGVTWDHPRDRGSNRRRRWAAGFAWKHARTIVANDSAFLREMGLEIAPGEGLFEEVAERKFLLPNVVDEARFSPGPALPWLAGTQVILVPRTMVHGRGAHLAIKAFARVAEERNDTLMIVAGFESDPDYVKRVRRTVVELGLSGRLLFAGLVPHELLVGMYRSAALTVIPSLYSEGTSLAALESMSCGTPVVATAVGGLQDLPCLHVAPSTESLASAMLKALDAGAELGNEQRDAVLARFRLSSWKETWLRAVAA